MQTAIFFQDDKISGIKPLSCLLLFWHLCPGEWVLWASPPTRKCLEPAGLSTNEQEQAHCQRYDEQIPLYAKITPWTQTSPANCLCTNTARDMVEPTSLESWEWGDEG